MHRRNMTLALILGSLALAAGACDSGSTTASRASGPAPQSGLPTTRMQIGSRTFTLEIAAKDHERSIGLMHRDSMPADHGMIFVFRKEEPLSFWMKNTRIPLDILYVDSAGKIVSIHQMRPLDLNPVGARGLARYAIELNQGMAAAAGVKDGDQLQLPDDVQSIKPDALLAP